MIRVKKPFDTLDVFDAVEKKVEEKIIHREEEEKHVVEPVAKISEDVHGGNEVTFSMPHRNVGEEERKEEQSENTDGEAEGKTSGEKREGEDTEDVKEAGEKAGEKVDEKDNEKDDVEERGDETKNLTHREEDVEEDEEDKENVEDDDVKEEEEKMEEEDVEEDEEEKEHEEEEDEEWNMKGGYNAEQVVDLRRHFAVSFDAIKLAFDRFIDMFAEDKTKIYTTSQYDEYNIRKLMFRKYEGKPLSAYRQGRVRESVVLILDNSGSMTWWTWQLLTLSRLAQLRGDVEIYIAPNGHIEEILDARGRFMQVNHNAVMKRLSGRRIIYVGDYDGADTAIELSWRNDVVWIAPERRYRRFRAHDWVQYDESQFHGVFIRIFDLAELPHALRAVTRFHRLFIDLHENHQFFDDD